MSERFATGINGLGRSRVRGRSLSPRPADKMMAFTGYLCLVEFFVETAC